MVAIGVAGKGGTGKTTLAALIVCALLRAGNKPVLAVDADPNSTLSDALGVEQPRSIVQITDEVARIRDSLPPGMDKAQYLEFRVRDAIRESEGFDLLLMGRTEGPGCYCAANHILRECLDKLQHNYAFVVMDNEAGLEHLSRRTTRNLDILFITSQITRSSARSVENILSVGRNLDLSIRHTCLVLNEYGSATRAPSKEINFPLPPAFCLPFDSEVLERSEEGKGLLDIPDDSPACAAVRKNLFALLSGFGLLAR